MSRLLKYSRRAALFGGGAALGGMVASKFSPSTPTLHGTRSIKPVPSPGVMNDASGLSQTPVFKHITIKKDREAELIDVLRKEMKDAAFEGRPVNVGAARHSMGGHAIPRNGHAITLDNDTVQIDPESRMMRVHAGARWSDVIARADPMGLGPKVMQSNNDFGVAATFCVNAHGWAVKQGPMGSTVQAFDMLLTNGSLVTCSRTQNPGFFKMTMGGYGLTGLITSMDVQLAKNERLEPTFDKMDAGLLGEKFMEALTDKTVTMAYGRLSVGREDFMSEALLVTYRASEDQTDIPAAQGSGFAAKIASRVYRAQLGNERMKGVRWWFETDLATTVAAGPVTRNNLINEPVVTLDDRDPDRTDILHEYFIPPDRWRDFLTVCRTVIPASYQEFLNVTLRFIDKDEESWLSYATVPRISAVMSFSQEMTARGETDMKRMTQELIDGIIGIGGTYYLPYRPHARQDQFISAYPRSIDFVKAKKLLDPEMILRNNFWDKYMGDL